MYRYLVIISIVQVVMVFVAARSDAETRLVPGHYSSIQEAIDDTDIELRFCAITDNDGGARGGGIVTRISPSVILLERCTVSRNAAVEGGAAYVQESAGSEQTTITVRSRIFWDNGPDPQFGSEMFTVRYSDMEGGFPGTGNIEFDPLFIAPEEGNYGILPSSRCVDAGDPASPPDPEGSVADMGRIRRWTPAPVR